jgi:hypothetical protein
MSSFNFELEDDEPQPQQPARLVNPAPHRQVVTQQAVDDLFEEDSPADELDAQMSEVERRLEKAQYYRVLISQSLFEVDSDVGAEVEAEVREFVRNRMSVLVGASPERTAAESFSTEEIRVLKEVASKLSKNAKLMPEAKEPPRVNPVKNVAPPAVQSAPAPISRPVTKPAPVPARRPGPKPKAPPPPVAKAEPKPPPGKPRKAKVLDEVIVMKNGENGPEMTYRKVQTDRGTCYLDDQGREYTLAVNGSGQSYMRNETKQSVPAANTKQPVAPVSLAQQNMISQQHATATLNGLQKNPLLSGALSELLK